MRSALFGGTFDPVHNGHLEIARAAAERFALDRVLLIPGGDPPHKATSRTAYEDRYQMVELACAGDRRLAPSRLEAPETLEGRPSYSIDTIERVRAGLAPGDELFFLLGEDAFRDLSIWYRLDEVAPLIEFLVVSREGEGRVARPAHPAIRYRRLDGVRNPVSSSEIRRRVADGESIAGLVPPDVAEYIAAERLYVQ